MHTRVDEEITSRKLETLLASMEAGVFPQNVRLIPLQPCYRMHRTLVLAFLRTRERDPNGGVPARTLRACTTSWTDHANPHR
ncbi:MULTISPECIES: hypothetical protein [unclassified Variovorax]|uniref:hypothetical protein n=1 Tax=unclassified Variovorax TaxID=663243 RepID=UPI003F459931